MYVINISGLNVCNISVRNTADLFIVLIHRRWNQGVAGGMALVLHFGDGGGGAFLSQNPCKYSDVTK